MNLYESINKNLKKNKGIILEGAGAGYEISGSIEDANVLEYKIVDTSTDSYGYPVYTLDCKIDVTIKDLAFSSYYYGDEVDFPVYATISKLVIVDNGLNGNDEGPELTKEAIEETLTEASFKEMLGGGWSHVTFTGEIDGRFDNEGYADFYVDDFTMMLVDSEVIKFIDDKVSGNIDGSTYEVFDDDNQFIESFDDSDEAIKYAKDNGYYGVEEIYHNYHLIDSEGSMDDDQESGETIWSRDSEEEE